MHNCKTIKDLILTDYIDTELNSDTKKQIEDHLYQCKACQSFAKEVRESLIVPFEKVNRQEVPSYIWENIKEKIVHPQPQPGFSEVVQGWFNAITFPRLMPGLVSLVTLLFITSTVFFNWQTNQAKEREDGAYIEYMLSSAATNQKDYHALGTPIEQYFL